MAKRVAITITDDFYEFLANEAESMGIPIATVCTVMLQEARKTRENVSYMKAVMERMQKIEPELFAKIIAQEVQQLELGNGGLNQIDN